MNVSDLDRHFLDIYKRALAEALDNHVRSSKKLALLHSGFVHILVDGSSARNLKVSALGLDPSKQGFSNRETSLNGKFYRKKVDVSIVRVTTNASQTATSFKLALGFKMIMSNFKQNFNNYFESMLGETVNIRLSNTPYYQVLVFPKFVPYYRVDKRIRCFERIDDSVLDKYRTLMSQPQSDSHRPDAMLICCFDNTYDAEILQATCFEDYKKLCLEHIDSFKLTESMTTDVESDSLFVNQPGAFVAKLRGRIEEIE